MNRTFALILAAIVVIALAQSVILRELTFHLLFGWLAYLGRVLPEVVVRWDGVAFYVVGLAAFTVILHDIAVWLRREICEGAAAWRWRSTIQVVGLVVMMFVAGIALVGVTHQAAWLATDHGKLFVSGPP